MPRESIYQRYKPSHSPEKSDENLAYWFLFKESQMLVEVKDNDIQIPLASKTEEFKIHPIRTQCIGTFNGHTCYCGEVDCDEAPEGMLFRDLRSVYENFEEDIYLVASRAFQIVQWDSNHQFCGKCGTPTKTAPDELAKICPECGYTSYTRISPAVITAIVKDGKLLMAKHKGRSGNMYGLIAGFVEAGETLEEAVQRETLEEVGLKLKNIKYFASQSWPFPHSLMMGFTAEYVGGEIKVDGKEITDAEWFSPEELPRIPSKMSIARDLIDWYIENY
ncbi:MAG: NAD(+) diphosphatase [Methanobacteriaceae archaeon]|nr:NAD(+) diphosphatase [Methanobacteriaceae archaeon]